MGQLQAAQAEQRIAQMRQTLREAGVPNVGDDFISAWRGDGSLVRDYAATAAQLQQRYDNFLAEQRYTQSHGANWRDLRIGNSGMTVPQFEARVLQVQQSAVDAAYDRGKELIATGQLPLKNGNYALTLGTYVDWVQRDALRQLGRQEGLPDSSASNVFAVNRRISGQGEIGYPDLRVGANTISDVSLSAKNATTELLCRAGLDCATDQAWRERRMSKLSEGLQVFQGSVSSATVYSPDAYPDWHFGWTSHRADLLALWSDVKPRLKRDLDKVELIDQKLAEAFESFDRGQREPGRSLMVEIYNVLNLNTLR
jgi:hypothetical protein